MPIIHYLNVKSGDCSVITHYSGHVTVIDVSNAKGRDLTEGVLVQLASKGALGNFNQKKYPVNPVTYLQDRDIDDVFRFILTNPDMDHMDGIKYFFEEFSPANFWDTDNNASKTFPSDSPFKKEDWDFYKSLRDSKPTSDPKRLTLYSGSKGKFWNVSKDGSGGGDGLRILSPTPELVKEANKAEDYNDSSYVIRYLTGGHKILFAGDSHDKTWEHILKKHEDSVKDIDLLIAPHHGRKSAPRSYEFLDVLKPRLTFFGNAPSEHLAYDAWNNRKLDVITNNQAGCMIVDAEAKTMKLYVTHKPFAKKLNSDTHYSEEFKAYYCGEIT